MDGDFVGQPLAFFCALMIGGPSGHFELTFGHLIEEVSERT